MNLRSDRDGAAEALAAHARWGLVLLCFLILATSIGTPIVTAGLAYAASSGVILELFYRVRARRNVNRAHLGSWIRCTDIVLLTATLFHPALRSTDVWGLGVLVVVGHAYVSKDQVSTLLLGAIVLAGLWASAAYNHVALVALAVPTCAVTIGAIAGLALADYKVREAVQSVNNHRLASLLECGYELAASRDLGDTVLHTLKSAVHDTGATCGYVMLVDDNNRDRLKTETAYSVGGEFEFPHEIEVGAGLSGYVAKVGQPVSVSSASLAHQDFDGVTEGVKSAACVPLIVRSSGSFEAAVEQVLGSMTLLNTRSGDGFTAKDMELLRTLGSLISVAVSSARTEERRRTTFLFTLESLATALEARDEYTRGHSQRVCEVSLMIGETMGLGAEAMEELRVGTILHDIGKIGVPDAILNKKGKLTDDEFTVMKSHPVIGYEICKPLMLSEGVLLIIRNHHEKLDGCGYPDGLKGGELPLSLRIVCVADAFDAMSSLRPYRNVMASSEVLAELSMGAGTQFDPVVVERLKELMTSDRLVELYRQYWGDGGARAA